jgi:APA family basic amino acid/polyamine antiporter
MATSERSPRAGVFRRKPIGEPEPTIGPEGRGLTRSLGRWQLTAIGIGGIIGAGVFALAGAVANETAGPAVLVSFVYAFYSYRRSALAARD